ncbi:carbamate kinase [Sinorhizobium meliloti]|uniref:carbamate kinase n=1 Tax=Rhizobium meliloti TaxID=382 RepID=UPI0002A560BB|nr:carbamate kinase [Sinorhizobium meliloti]AGA09808.1 carbamate kinase [Sinorhizobium meliloti GR4]MDW9545816.1 carbamate kinase [Sinorhizobium meliloti]MDW9619386.1 carbamate kinase [Sinorhizobium meliloti]MDW9856127.1 carbamate kinase [Sinorhizobium meliloti]MDW9874855.1 carbamate kinase [Sinorhizobium meliloti]
MRVVIALGGNALLKRGEPMTAEVQRQNIKIAAEAIAPIAAEHQIVVTHGNGPQVGLLALQGSAYKPEEAYPLDILGAETEGMIGYMLEQELGNVLPFEVPLATILTMVEVDGNDPGFQNPTKFVGPVYEASEAAELHEQKGWVFKQDGNKWRRVVASPIPRRIFELRPIQWLLDKGAVVICAGGGGIPTMYERGKERTLIGVEAVIDKDLCSALLARDIEADLLILATDAEAVFTGWGTPERKAIFKTNPRRLGQFSFPAGSMGPKVEAACHFVNATGRVAAIGALADIPAMVRAERGTIISSSFSDITWHVEVPIPGPASRPA